jgi:hypothetical protein
LGAYPADRVTHIASDLESAKVKAKSLFDTLNMPQNPDGLRILDQSGNEVFFWTPGMADSWAGAFFRAISAYV